MRVTITGADNDVDPAELKKLSWEYPFVEWGILYSHKRQGTPRYPDRDWIAHLADEAKHPIVQVAVHLCGSAAREMVAGQSIWPVGGGVTRTPFQRIQINGYTGKLHRKYTRRPGPELILQVREASEICIVALDVLEMPNASILYDPSGGRGIAPQGWPDAPAGVRMGVAGGIGLDNVVEVWGQAGAVGASWVDMETSVRNVNDRFDLVRVRAVLKAVADEENYG